MEKEDRLHALQQNKEMNMLLDARFDEVNGYDFYKFIFPNNELKGVYTADYSQPNAVYVYSDGEKMRRRIMLNDTWEQDFTDYVESCPQAFTTGYTYLGRSNKDKYIHSMNAMIFDLDKVERPEFEILWARIESKHVPRPTFLVTSGTGLHVYYVFQQPIKVNQHIIRNMKKFYDRIFWRIAERGETTKTETLNYLRPTQTFRMVGSTNDKYDTVLRAYHTGERVTLDYLKQFVFKQDLFDENEVFKPSKITREEASLLYPEWYDRKVIKGRKANKKWDIAAKVHGKDPFALYHWWLRRKGEIVEGHRYFFMLCLVWYATKCDVPIAKLKADMKDVFDFFQAQKHKKDMEQKDIDNALKVYRRKMYNVTIEDIARITGLTIQRNKRNGRTQGQHMKIMNAIRDVLHPNGEWRNKNGRPKGSGTKAQLIADWRAAHPDGKKIDCERETGLSRHTVLKWWN